TIEQLTRDHSLVAEQVRLGILTPEQAEHSEYQTMLIRALGASESVEVDVDEHVMLDGDCYLLCSDGLSRMVPDDQIADAIRSTPKSQKAADHLIDLAKQAGGLDNVTAVLVRCQPKPRRLFGLFRRDGCRFLFETNSTHSILATLFCFPEFLKVTAQVATTWSCLNSNNAFRHLAEL